MKISYSGKPRYCMRIGQMKQGVCVEFEDTFHQKHKADDVFIVTDDTYINDDRICAYSKVTVVNLRTGCIARVNEDRRCRSLNAVIDIQG